MAEREPHDSPDRSPAHIRAPSFEPDGGVRSASSELAADGDAVTVSCPSCGTPGARPRLAARDVNLRTSRDEFTIYSCSACGLAFTDPRVQRMEMATIYAAGYQPYISYAVFCLKKKNQNPPTLQLAHTTNNIKEAPTVV